MSASSPPARPWLVACLCAAWCRTCDDYRGVMAEAARRHPAMRFAWVDIEDHADALDDPQGQAADIENFPTLLIAQGGQPFFFGTVLPHAALLDRLLDQAARGALPTLNDAAARRLTHAVETLQAQQPRAVQVA